MRSSCCVYNAGNIVALRVWVCGSWVFMCFSFFLTRRAFVSALPAHTQHTHTHTDTGLVFLSLTRLRLFKFRIVKRDTIEHANTTYERRGGFRICKNVPFGGAVFQQFRQKRFAKKKYITEKKTLTCIWFLRTS